MRGEEQSLIHGLELQGRALGPLTADTENISFLVGTQSLRHENMLYKVTLDEDTNQLGKVAFKHRMGEVWHLDTSPDDLGVFSSTYGEKRGDIPGGWRKRAAILALPAETEGDLDGEGEQEGELEVRAELNPLLDKVGGGEVSSVTFQPNLGTRVVCLAGDKVVLADLGQGGVEEVWSITHSVRGQTRVQAGRFNTHRNCHQFATACGSQVIAWDTRSSDQCWLMQQTAGGMGGNIRSLDFNPNKQYYVCTGGDDGVLAVWDSRNCTEPLYSHRQHSHWVWSCRYNMFHDQLLLTAGSDSRVVLSSLASLSSEPYGHLVEEEGEQVVVQQEDGVIQVWGDHEDSVYTAEWSSADPWTFASLSYDGRLVIGRVPRTVKFRILNL